jgi:general secretion pathway protein I
VKEDGFSLIELLVAVSILSLAAVTLLQSQTQAISMSTRVEERSLAAIVAENQMNLALGQLDPLQAGITRGREAQMGVPFEWTRTVSSAAGSELMLVTVSIRRAGAGEEMLSLTGFRKAN